MRVHKIDKNVLGWCDISFNYQMAIKFDAKIITKVKM